MHQRLIRIGSLLALALLSILCASCSRRNTTFTQEERKAVDSIVRLERNEDSLVKLQQQFERENNLLGSVVVLRRYGNMLRNESRFESALKIHSAGLKRAEAMGDTIELVQALNNLGTDYRRLGELDAAQDYHYLAWTLCRETSDTTYLAQRNKVVSLNGLGNIYLQMGNLSRADSTFRLSLAGEIKMKDTLGMAINNANIGCIFEQKGQIDSAWVYYRRSMELNKQAKSDLGISICHTYFGSLYEKDNRYEDAMREYESAYELMRDSEDKWHAINSLIAIAGVHHAMGHEDQVLDYLARAKDIAEQIKSTEHLAKVYHLYYQHYKRVGDHSRALACYERASALDESLIDMEKSNRILNTTLRIERAQQKRYIDKANYTIENQRETERNNRIIFISILLVLVCGVVTLLYIMRLRNQGHKSLKQMNTLREVFYTNITHEFRTPLTVILGLSKALETREDLPSDVRDKMVVIQRQGKSLLKLINQLLDISKIKSSAGDPAWCHGDISTQISMIVESYQDYAESQNLQLQFTCQDHIMMDFVPDYVNKLMNNLLSNALKFTPEHGKVNVSVWQESATLHITVSDTGKGMEPEELEHIFEPFYQVAHTVNYAGTGIGLSLVRLILDSIGGTIVAESEPNKGTTFSVSVPVKHEIKKPYVPDDDLESDEMIALSDGEQRLEDQESDGEHECCRILVIEDNPDVANYIGSQLEGEYAISYASDGVQGVARARELVPDLIITDLMMPGMDGLDVCRQIRVNTLTDHIPVIVVTAKVSEEDRIAGLEAGADAYLTKPFNHDELRVRVEKLLQRCQMLREKYSQYISEGKEEEVSMPDLDREFVAKTVSTLELLMQEQKVDIDCLADRMCLSARQFRRKITAITGDSPAAFILRSRMKRAQQLIATEPDLTMEQVSEQCGFNNYNSFYLAFRKFYGYSPTQYKQSLE